MTQATVPLGRLPATFAALAYPNFRRWFIGQILSLMGTWMQAVAQGWLVYELTGSKLALGTISFAGSIPTLFLMLPAGVVADRISKRKLLIWSQAGAMACAFALAALSLPASCRCGTSRCWPWCWASSTRSMRPPAWP